MLNSVLLFLACCGRSTGSKLENGKLGMKDREQILDIGEGRMEEFWYKK